MPAKRLAASKASYPMATTKIKIIQSTPPPRPSCLLVVIEATRTFTAHAGGTHEILDNEHRDFMLSRNDQGSNHARFGIDEVISALSINTKPSRSKTPTSVE